MNDGDEKWQFNFQFLVIPVNDFFFGVNTGAQTTNIPQLSGCANTPRLEQPRLLSVLENTDGPLNVSIAGAIYGRRVLVNLGTVDDVVVNGDGVVFKTLNGSIITADDDDSFENVCLFSSEIKRREFCISLNAFIIVLRPSDAVVCGAGVVETVVVVNIVSESKNCGRLCRIGFERSLRDGACVVVINSCVRLVKKPSSSQWNSIPGSGVVGGSGVVYDNAKAVVVASDSPKFGGLDRLRVKLSSRVDDNGRVEEVESRDAAGDTCNNGLINDDHGPGSPGPSANALIPLLLSSANVNERPYVAGTATLSNNRSLPVDNFSLLNAKLDEKYVIHTQSKSIPSKLCSRKNFNTLLMKFERRSLFATNLENLFDPSFQPPIAIIVFN
ncbi:hypothetical protein DERP_001617 [Dermatophagoides pteronyssinus]|uniref:Uncharacterized protein n=1 Tax=Dermatophagoides pteronyssinus TaxID=6956 RepID=A0ABQ8JBR4_DERPT|nr:hypothetical protein DERP_001617 [Dermatophagoides pteronyssinus]